MSISFIDESEYRQALESEVARLQEDLCRWRLAWEQASLERRQWRECAERLARALEARGGHCRACCDDDKDDDLALAEFGRLKGASE
jgi:non-ribosomal peptide synthetase component F